MMGGRARVRSACKNFASVTVVVRPEDYPMVLEELRREGEVSAATRRRLPARALAPPAARRRAPVRARRAGAGGRCRRVPPRGRGRAPVPRGAGARLPPGARSALRREPAPGG